MENLRHQAQGHVPPEELETISDQVIDTIRRDAILEPENQVKLGLVGGTRKSITCLSLCLMIRFVDNRIVSVFPLVIIHGCDRIAHFSGCCHMHVGCLP